MSLLAPLFLLGGLAIAGPLLFHLIRRTTRERVKFGSLMFLQPSPPQLTQRSRLEHWLLLLLRLLALLLLALAFARPLWRRQLAAPETAMGPGSRTVVLLDTSASLRRAGLWDEAQRHAAAALDALGPLDSAAVMTFANSVTTLVDFDTWHQTAPAERESLVRSRLEAVTPSWQSTGLASALMEAAERLSEVSDEPGRPLPAGHIVVISDFQEGSRLQGLQAFEWPHHLDVTLRPVGATAATTASSNAGLQLAAEAASAASSASSSPTPDGTTPPAARVRIGNAAGAAKEVFQLGWATADGTGFLGAAQDVTVPPGQQRMASVPWPASESTANVALAMPPTRLLLRGDDEPFDNMLFVLPPATLRVPVTHFGTAPPDDPKQSLFFLRRALPSTTALAVDLDPIAPDAPVAVEPLKQAAFHVVTGPVSEPQADALHERLIAGQTVVLALTGLEVAPTLARLAGLAASALAVEEATPPNYAMWAKIDFQHPLFAPFADPRFSDFTKIRFWKYRRLAPETLPGSRVLVEFDSGAPALLEAPVGQGRLLVFTAGWQPADSQLALSSKFPPLLASLLEWTGAGLTPPLQFLVGEPVSAARLGLSPAASPATASVTLPNQTTHTLTAEAPTFTATEEPGVYQFTVGSTTRPFVINLDPAESRTTPLPADELERLGVPLVKTSTHREPARAASPELATALEAESRQKLWRWLLVVALGVLLLETWLAGRTARRVAATSTVSVS